MEYWFHALGGVRLVSLRQEPGQMRGGPFAIPVCVKVSVRTLRFADLNISAVVSAKDTGPQTIASFALLSATPALTKAERSGRP